VMLYALSNSTMMKIVKKHDVPVCGEVFADRGYSDDGTLAPRDKPGGMIEDQAKSVAQALAMVQSGKFAALSGKMIEVRADTLCLHGDQPGAVPFAKAIRKAFAEKGIAVAAP